MTNLNTAKGKMSLKRNHVGKPYKYMYDTNYVWYESNSHLSKERKGGLNLSESAYTCTYVIIVKINY